MYGLLTTIADAVWFILPAYIANGTPVIFGGGPPIDGHKNLPDGNRVFGDGKTILGFVTGIIGGSFIGLVQTLFWSRPGGWEVGLLLSLGALIGDMMGSFFKRRIGLSRGEPLPGLDQLEFIAGAVILGSLLSFPSWEVLAVLFVFTPLIHLGANFVSCKMGFKQEPY